MLLSDDALILDHSPFRDRHLVLAILSAEHGVIRGILRGARKSKNGAGATVQVLSLVHFTSFRKPAADMTTFRQIDLLRSSYPVSTNLEASAASAVVAEMLLTFCPLSEPAPRRFRLGVAALDALLEGVDSSSVVTYVQLWILQLSGLFPDIGSCSRCDAPLEDNFRVSARDGFIVCGPCSDGPDRPDSSDSPVHRLTSKDFAFVDIASKTAPAALRGKPTTAFAAWLDALIRSAAEKPMRALEFFRRSDVRSHELR